MSQQETAATAAEPGWGTLEPTVCAPHPATAAARHKVGLGQTLADFTPSACQCCCMSVANSLGGSQSSATHLSRP
jgi:hypothetical protein